MKNPIPLTLPCLGKYEESYSAYAPLFRESGSLESGGLESGGLESRATDFGSDSAHSGSLESGGLESGGLESGGLESRATDFGSGSVLIRLRV